MTNKFWVNDISLAAQKSLQKNSRNNNHFPGVYSKPSESNSNKNFDMIQQKKQYKWKSLEGLDSLKKKKTRFFKKIILFNILNFMYRLRRKPIKFYQSTKYIELFK